MRMRDVALLSALFISTVAFAQDSPSSAHADFINSQGQKVGTAHLTQTADGVKIDAEVAHLAPGTHAFHIHAVAKCDLPDFKSAGGHFNPTGKQHGKDNPLGSHAGDMMNFEVKADGSAHFSVVNAAVTLGSGPNSLFHDGGTALVIHEKADDYKTDPTGNAGNRVACGVIER